MKKLKLTVNGVVILARLLEDKAPQAVNALAALCPFSSHIQHARLIASEVLFPAPMDVRVAENRVPICQGDVCFYTVRQSVILFYGDKVPPLSNKIGEVEAEYLPVLAEMGQQTWQKEGAPVLVEMVEE